MFKATRILKNGSIITVKLALNISGGYAIHITNCGNKSVEGVYPRRHIAVKVAQAILRNA